jgi:2-polyprenyl-3-methyl-5-hydroxy-6-metoxy-1,4-benzoquinol methylase
MANSTVNEETRDIWNQNAAFWDQRAGDSGLPMQRTIIDPVTERLLDLQPGERVLDIACGNGAFARRMAQRGASVVACDFSEAFVAHAKERTVEDKDHIEYHVVDATNETQLLALGTQSFDAAVCTMGLMDMPVIEPLFSALGKLLNPGGQFVFSITHPCFNSGVGMKMVVEQEDKDGDIIIAHSIKISNYATPITHKGLGIIGQPAAQYYFHRPINVYLNAAFRAGFVLDALEEPTYPADAKPNRPFSWENYHEIPPVLIVRLRLVP